MDTSVVPHSQTIGNVIVVDPRTDTLYDVFDRQTYGIDYATGTLTPTDLHFAWSSRPTRAARGASRSPSPRTRPRPRRTPTPRVMRPSPCAPAATCNARGTVAITCYDLRHLTAGNTTTLPTATWLLTFPRGAEQHATERRISGVFDWLQAPYAGGHFLGDYEGLGADGPFAVRPLFVETNAHAPQDSTDAYSGLLSSGTDHGPVASAAVTPRVTGPKAAARPPRTVR
ncbi:hypothetical protein [Streptomyces sp. NPDC046197]|uniref:hypothetical protein n=1 Tax=Streptomyces sp. NPDC046197 TaxID=3154337 RepID=UPI0033DC604D